MLRRVFAIVGIMAGFIAYGLCGPTVAHLWIIVVVGILAYYACSVLVILWTMLLSCTIDLNRTDYTYSPLYHYSMAACGQVVCMLCKIHWRIEGLVILPKEPVLLVGNHRSRFDPILTFSLFPNRKLAFISKPENFRIPFVGKMMFRNRYVPIDRRNNRNAAGAIGKAAELVKNEGYSIGIYPEGKRNRNVDALLPFKAGSFKVATLAQIPVVLMSFDGTERIRKNFLYKPTLVRIRFLEVLHPTADTDTKQLAQWSQDIIADSLRKQV